MCEHFARSFGFHRFEETEKAPPKIWAAFPAPRHKMDTHTYNIKRSHRQTLNVRTVAPYTHECQNGRTIILLNVSPVAPYTHVRPNGRTVIILSVRTGQSGRPVIFLSVSTVAPYTQECPIGRTVIPLRIRTVAPYTHKCQNGRTVILLSVRSVARILMSVKTVAPSYF